MIQCCGCRGAFPDTTGPTHRYMSSAPACWAMFGGVLAKEYSDTAYFTVHQLTVDAYAVQHPGADNPQARQSVMVHLATLYGYFEQGLRDDRSLIGLRKQMSKRVSFPLLEPPPDYQLTVLDVYKAASAEAHCEQVKAWGLSAWQAWKNMHPELLSLFKEN